MKIKLTKVLQYLGLIAFMLLIGAIYYRFNPMNYGFFPQCPLRLATGLECPGCGSQRALHALLHWNWAEAYAFNPLLVLSIPYLAIGFALEIPYFRQKAHKLRSYAFGYWGSIVWAIIVIAYWIGRNLV